MLRLYIDDDTVIVTDKTFTSLSLATSKTFNTVSEAEDFISDNWVDVWTYIDEDIR